MCRPGGEPAGTENTSTGTRAALWPALDGGLGKARVVGCISDSFGYGSAPAPCWRGAWILYPGRVMPAFDHLRMLDAFSRQDTRTRTAVLARLGAMDPPQGARDLAEPEAIRRRLAGLPEADLRWLSEWATVDPVVFSESVPPDLRDRALAQGVCLAIAAPSAAEDAAEEEEDFGEGAGPVWTVLPFEVRAVLCTGRGMAQADLALLLLSRDEEELLELAELHSVAEPEALDRWDLVLAIAGALLQDEALRDLLDSLQPASRTLLQWLHGHGRPIPEAVLHARADRLLSRDAEPAQAAERVLLRVGLLHRLPGEGSTLLALPSDVRRSLTLLLDEQLTSEVKACWQDLRNAALPAFRDVVPRGVGGDPLRAARMRLLRTLVYEPLARHPLDDVLEMLRIVDPENGVPGEYASLHLDVSSPDAFARQALRTWLGQAVDPFTSALMGAFGADVDAMADYVHGEGEATAADPDREIDRERWLELVLHVRAHLLCGLSLLPAGHWFPIPVLARWLTTTYRLVHLRAETEGGWGPRAPGDALPLNPMDLESDTDDAVAGALRTVLRGLLEPIGAVLVDRSGRLLMTQSEALRVFRDGDPGFHLLWEAAEATTGDDLDLWLPLPNDPGARTSGVADVRWVDDTGLVLDADAHLHDLLRLAQWTAPEHDGTELVFRFDATHVARGEESGADAEDFLLWLRVRTGHPVPTRVRALFSMSSAVADGTEPAVDAAVVGRVSTLLHKLQSWGDTPSLTLMEELRGWGPRIVRQLLAEVDRSIRQRRFRRTDLPHILLLLGELGDPRACPALLRALAFAEDELVEGIAAMACARIGGPAMQGLIALLNNPAAGSDKQLAAAATLSSLAVLHPEYTEAVVQAISRFLSSDELEADVLTIAGVHLAETGHPDVESILFQLREQGLWVEELMQFDEAIWVASISPAVWGHPIYAAPLALIFPTSSESRHLTEEAGIDELLRGSGVQSDAILGDLSGPTWKRRRP